MIRTIVVDDEPAALERYASYVEDYGHRFTVVARCSCARDAFAAVAKENPALLLTDIRMPREDGLSLLSRLRDAGWKGLAVIISGYDDFAYAQQAIRLGVFDFLLKPLFPEDMRNLLDRIGSRLASDKFASERITGEAFAAESRRAVSGPVSTPAAGRVSAGYDPGTGQPGQAARGAQAAQSRQVSAASPFTGAPAPAAPARASGMASPAATADSRASETVYHSAISNYKTEAAPLRSAPVTVLPEPVRRALAFMELHYDSRFSLEEAARAACVSPSWLSSSFRRIFGCSFMEYARRYRVESARTLLAESDLPLKEIADRLSFPDLPTFSKLFRKIVGTSPGAYRRSCRDGAATRQSQEEAHSGSGSASTGAFGGGRGPVPGSAEPHE
jgi:two-component system response regulator YesN